MSIQGIRNTCGSFTNLVCQAGLGLAKGSWWVIKGTTNITVAGTQAVFKAGCDAVDSAALRGFMSEDNQRLFEAKLRLFTPEAGLRGSILNQASRVNKLAFVNIILAESPLISQRDIEFAMIDAARHGNIEMMAALQARSGELSPYARQQIVFKAVASGSLRLVEQYATNLLDIGSRAQAVAMALYANRSDMIDAILSTGNITLDQVYRIAYEAARLGNTGCMQLLPIDSLTENQRGELLIRAIDADSDDLISIILDSGSISEVKRSYSLQKALDLTLARERLGNGAAIISAIANSGRIDEERIIQTIQESCDALNFPVALILIQAFNDQIPMESRLRFANLFMRENRLEIADKLIKNVSFSADQIRTIFNEISREQTVEVLSDASDQDFINVYKLLLNNLPEEFNKVGAACEAIEGNKEEVLEILDAKFHYSFQNWMDLISFCFISGNYSFVMILIPKLIASLFHRA